MHQSLGLKANVKRLNESRPSGSHQAGVFVAFTEDVLILLIAAKPLILLVGGTGFEPVAPGV
jgi:hypothetical protein